jgi:hypothetical protein
VKFAEMLKAPDLNGCFGKEGELARRTIDRNERAISFRSLPAQAFFGNRFLAQRS